MDISKNLPQMIKYRGHSGMESASPATSTGHVVLHESKHIREFEAEAALEGKTVKNEQIRIQYEFRDGKLVAVSGEATALIADKKKNGILSKEQILISEEGKNKLSTKESANNEELQNPAKINNLPPDSKIILEKIEAKINKLKDDLNDFQNKTTSNSAEYTNNANSEKDGKVESNEDNPLMNSIQYFNKNQNKNNPNSDKDFKPGEKINLVL